MKKGNKKNSIVDRAKSNIVKNRKKNINRLNKIYDFLNTFEGRFTIIVFFTIIGFIVITANLYKIQIIQGNKWRAAGEEKYSSKNYIKAKRGKISTTDGQVLAYDNEDFIVTLDPTLIEEDNIDSVLNMLKRYIEPLEVENYKNEYLKSKKAKKQYLKIKHKISYSTKIAIEEQIDNDRKDAKIKSKKYKRKYKGVAFETSFTRNYVQNDAFQETLGFVNNENQGVYGIEKFYNKQLAGESGIIKGLRIPEAFLSIINIKNKENSSSGKDGNNLVELIEAFKKVKDIDYPIVVHIHTQKGKGYKLAEENKEPWHYVMPFNIEDGKPLNVDDSEDYTDVTKEYLIKKMKEDKTVVTITAGTPGNFSFSRKEREELGAQFVDVGIAEQTAVALASGMASKGAKPVFTVVSSFIQRAYDQLSQDLCINNNPATIVVSYGGAIGMTDVTHLGWFDIAMMSNIPNLVYLAPTTKEEHLAMLEWSIEQQEHPVAIRLPGGKMVSSGKKVTKDFSKLNTYEVSQKGKKVAIIGLGTFYQLGEKVAKLYEEKTGVKATVINPMYITGVDEKLLEELKKDHSLVITLEDGVLDGGFGEKIARFYGNSDMKVLNYGLKKEFLDRHDIGKLLRKNRLKVDLIVEDLLKF